MTGPTPIAVRRSLRQLGENVRTWRKLLGLTTGVVADRAGISLDTLRNIETGQGGVSTENLLRVLRALGVGDDLVAATDPYNTDLGKLRADQVLPQRVRTSRR